MRGETGDRLPLWTKSGGSQGGKGVLYEGGPPSGRAREGHGSGEEATCCLQSLLPRCPECRALGKLVEAAGPNVIHLPAFANVLSLLHHIL